MSEGLILLQTGHSYGLGSTTLAGAETFFTGAFFVTGFGEKTVAAGFFTTLGYASSKFFIILTYLFLYSINLV